MLFLVYHVVLEVTVSFFVVIFCIMLVKWVAFVVDADNYNEQINIPKEIADLAESEGVSMANKRRVAVTLS